MNLAPASLSLLACALGAPDLQVSSAAATSRWRGPIGSATEVKIRADAPHRAARLQVLRRVLDRQADGRWALRVAADDEAGLLGPLRRAHGGRTFDLADCLASWPHPIVLRRLFLWVDGRRVDDAMVHRFPGAARDLALDPAPPLPPFLAIYLGDIRPPPDAKAALQLALHVHRRWLAARAQGRRGWLESEARVPLLPSHAFAAGSDDDGPHERGGAAITGTQRAGAAAARRIGAGVEASTPMALPDGTPGAGGDPSQPAAEPVENSAAGPRRIDGLPSAPAQTRGVTRHDEWDYHRQAYRRYWTAVHERQLQGTDMNFLTEIRGRFPSLAHQIRRRFARMNADAPRRERRRTDGDSVDLDAALDAVIARRAGPRHVEDRVYQARPRRERDVSVALLLDMSGSTGYPIRDRKGVETAQEDDQDDPLWQVAGSRPALELEPHRRVIDVAKDAVGLLCEALHTLGDRHAVFAFSGAGRLNVDFAVVKSFDQDWSAQPAAALAAVQPQGSTRTGAAVRHAMRHLRRESARRKILIVLSDGYPQDTDYGPARDDLQYGLQDTAHALREAERAGVSTFNISVDAAANDYLRRMCPRNRYWVVDDVDALPAKMLALYKLIAASP